MLRLAIWYENRLGRNDGNPLYVYSALKRLEKEGKLLVDHLIPNGDVKHFGKYDANIWVDWGEDAVASLCPYEIVIPSGAPLIYWASDTHLGYDYRLEMAKKADVVFVAQKDAVYRMQDDGVVATWLPHAVEPRAYNDADDPTGKKPYDLLTKKYDICFVGHISSENRIEALDRIFKAFPNFFYGQKLFNEAARKYAESKVVFNIAMKDDVNMRCFEALGSKSFLLTDKVQSIEDIFTDKEHLVLYDSLDDAIEKAKYYIEHDEEREKIALAGYQHVLKHHTIDNRVQVILNAIQQQLNAPKREPEIIQV